VGKNLGSAGVSPALVPPNGGEPSARWSLNVSTPRALVVWAAVAHLPHLQNLADRYARPLPDGAEFREYAGHRVSHRFLDAADRYDPLAGVAGFSGPTLIVHPGRDEYLPLSSPEDYYGASAASIKEKIIVPDADHTFTSVVWETEVIDRSVKWFQKHL
jgi:fermentation-respiration switch protein FrsA (DUF1100 family)